MAEHHDQARSSAPSSESSSQSLHIDCEDCIGPAVDACGDCVVTFLLDRDPGSAVVIDLAEARALRLLAEADLVPRLRHVRPAAGELGSLGPSDDFATVPVAGPDPRTLPRCKTSTQSESPRISKA